MKKLILMLLTLGLFTFGSASCESRQENATEETSEAADEMGDDIEDAGDEVEDEAGEVKDEVKD